MARIGQARPRNRPELSICRRAIPGPEAPLQLGLNPAPRTQLPGATAVVSPSFLNVLLKVAKVSLDLADGLLNISLEFKVLVADHTTSDLLDFAFRLFVATFDLLLVHCDLLSTT
jgi:hypothetical protein